MKSVEIGKIIKLLLQSLMIATFCVLLSGVSPVYRYVDAQGIVHFTDTPTHSYWSLYRKQGNQSTSVGKPSFASLIREYANRYRLDEALIKAVIKVESDYRPYIVSSKGAQGLMQLIPETARSLNVKDPFDPAENIRGGSLYLRLMLDRFDGDLELALAAYNAGPTAVQRYGGIPPFDETVNYIRRVKYHLNRYRQTGDALL